MTDTGSRPTECAWPNCSKLLKDFPQHGRWRYCPQHTPDAHKVEQNMRGFLNRRNFSRRGFFKATGAAALAGAGLLFERSDTDLFCYANNDLIPHLRGSLISLDLEAVRSGCRDLRERVAGNQSRDADCIRALAGELMRDAGPKRFLSLTSALDDLLSVNYHIERAWGELNDAFNLARGLTMRGQLYLLEERYKLAENSLDIALSLLDLCGQHDRVKTVKSETRRVKLRVAAMAGGKITEREEKEFFELIEELGRPSLKEKANREAVIWNVRFCTGDHSRPEKIRRFDRAEQLFDQAKKDYVSVPPPKPILAELGFVHQEIELDLLAGELGEEQRWSNGLEKLHDKFMPLLYSHPDAVHFKHLESLIKTFQINVQCVTGPAMLSPTLPRLYEDALGIAPVEPKKKEVERTTGDKSSNI